MKPRTIFWLLVLVSIGAFGAWGGWQRSRAAALRAERDRLVTQQLARAATPPRSNATVASDDIARLRRQQEEWTRTREELMRLERAIAVEKGEPTARASNAPAEDRPPLRGPMVKSAEWRDAGAASPEAALESFVWAATRGETETVGALLAIDPDGRKQLADVFARLSDEARASYGSPENMLATLIAVQVPQDLSAIGPVSALALNNGDIALRTRTERGGSIAKDAVLTFRLTDGRWRLVVPKEIAVGAVKAALRTPPAPKP
jgi:hypothetical protein